MNKSKILSFTLLVLLTLFSQLASSSQLRWLNYSPVSYFTDKDWELAKTATRETLNNGKDGVSVSWENPETKSHGTLTPLTTKLNNDTNCRVLKIENHANNMSGKVVYKFCKQDDGKWRVVER